MAKSKLAKKMEASGGVRNYIEPTDHKHYESDDELMEAMFESRSEDGTDGGTRLANANKRNSLMREAGFDFFDVKDLIPNPKNEYSIEPGSIEALASLIYESKVTTPLVLRATKEGYEIVDGERRYRAHQLLTERYGNRWRMVPARCFPVGTLSDEDAEFILHAENVGQRNMTPSERAMGFAAVADRVVAQRESDPSMKGKKTRDILAEQFGVSARTAQDEIAIGRGLSKEGMELYDEGAMTKEGAAAVAKLEPTEQAEIIEAIEEGSVLKEDIADVAKGRTRTSERKNKTADYHMESARKSLKRAVVAYEKGEKTEKEKAKLLGYVADIRGILAELDL